MNQTEADRQIEQMIAFIAQEAREKAEEISVKTEKEFMAEKLSLETQQSIAIRAEHEQRKKNFKIAKRIEKSKALTEARFSTMRRRDERVNEVFKEVLAKLHEVSKNPKYSVLLRFLIAQGLLTLLEPEVVLKVRKEDVELTKKELGEAIKLYQSTCHAQTGVTPRTHVTISDKEFLPSGSAGGVQLIAREGQIVINNTLDHRLEIAFEALKAAIRGILFGVREVLVGKIAPKKKHGH
jgi:V-type H+-transporting ATPase subunit E